MRYPDRRPADLQLPSVRTMQFTTTPWRYIPVLGVFRGFIFSSVNDRGIAQKRSIAARLATCISAMTAGIVKLSPVSSQN